MKGKKPAISEVRRRLQDLEGAARKSGYNLNPDEEHTLDLVESLLVNEGRYGYPSCPCRLAEGTREEDLDILCPCDYRDADLTEFGTCFCALYVDEKTAKGAREAGPIPERRPGKEERAKRGKGPEGKAGKLPPGSGVRGELAFPVFRCKVCGYLCARSEPPGKCPVCGADRDRFERFL